ncbi:hypothetical protein RFI_03230 [Reticulomyxa filosa]|uniref:Actin n=1 Tax=Reticulomyxa filosa TaxID=46433 RepID=X6P703_RETFI|nr:hypothetical protein RFI_03230 [Reticulomyxa filosa]|eukprot:ETO33859.1 hypothetical protein RFI_03230 [Reticulomyxa filosa]
MKESLCQVKTIPLNFSEEIYPPPIHQYMKEAFHSNSSSLVDEKAPIDTGYTYTLPDGYVIDFAKQSSTWNNNGNNNENDKNHSYIICERVFADTVDGLSNDKSKSHTFAKNKYKARGLCGMALDSLFACDMEVRAALCNNVVICGGSSRYVGFVERLLKEVLCYLPTSLQIKACYFDTLQERSFAVWMGGSILASIDNFQDQWITKHEFEEHGCAIVHKKCP